MLKLAVVVGIRPQFVKIAPFAKLAAQDKDVQLLMINTGQHYDAELSQFFFEELALPEFDYNLKVGSGSHAEQTARAMLALERVFLDERPDVVVVIGDGNSTLAGALTAAKLCIPAVHIEAGLRSFDIKMPEEVNRIVADHLATVLFPPTHTAYKLLLKEGIPKEKLCLVGDITVDVLEMLMPAAARSNVLSRFGLEEHNYVLVTLHRAANTDSKERLANIISALNSIADEMKVLFPVHPRTRVAMGRFNLTLADKVVQCKPLKLSEFLRTLKDAAVVLTDSGGVQKEAFILGTPCVTLRTTTEWPETLGLANILVGSDAKRIVQAFKKRSAPNYKEMLKIHVRKNNPFGRGGVAKKILKEIKDRFE
jgi:UDP-N-acetylglucosamine 2-epimerase